MTKEREWYTHGVISPTSYTLSDHYKKELKKIVGETHPKTEEFLLAIEDAIGSAKATEAHRQSTSPKAVRKNLKETKMLAENFYKSLCKLDQLSVHLISKSVDDYNHLDILNQIDNYKKIIASAYDKAQDLPKKGKLYQGHRRLLAYLIAAALKDILGITPTLYHESSNETSAKYARCLEVSLNAASFKNKNDSESNIDSLYPLMKQGIDTLSARKIDGGVTTLRKGSF